ncbi:transmembrane protein 126A, isoform CRA_a, partial [Mus musculus]
MFTFIKSTMAWRWWHTPLIPALGRRMPPLPGPQPFLLTELSLYGSS